MRVRLALVSVGMSVLFVLALALAPVDLREAASYATGHPLEVALVLLAYTGAFVLRAASWRTLIGARVPIAKLFALLMGALFLNHAAPAKAGDLARMYALSRWGVSTAEAVMSVVLSRFADLAGLLAVLVASLALAGSGGWGDISFPILILAGVAAALFVLARLRLPASFGDRFGAVRRCAGRARAALRETTWANLLRSFAFAAPAWVLEASILLIVGWGLGLELSSAEVVAATCFAVLVAAVPLAPGSLGTYEAGMVAALLVFGVPAESAFAAAVATHAIKFLYALAAAPFAFVEGLAVVRKERKPDEAGVEV
ncbi:MAG: Gll0941 protein [uncultured Rubrobacteraceae bacterium]|uniref:Gll0941 protein n=1 Tax=uncultured Rubrobacteraceae bacterium TaxID=349277 RepID=A0A6J4QDK5_9ACTN|nr:MAG: Gll0941 protein [uncultured Rubrobacteraceae bacterium]